MAKAIKILSGLGLATSTWSLVHAESHDGELSKVVLAFEAAANTDLQEDKRPAALAAVDLLVNYLSKYDPTDSTDVIKLGLMYRIIADPVFEEGQ